MQNNLNRRDAEDAEKGNSSSGRKKAQNSQNGLMIAFYICVFCDFLRQNVFYPAFLCVLRVSAVGFLLFNHSAVDHSVDFFCERGRQFFLGGRSFNSGSFIVT